MKYSTLLCFFAITLNVQAQWESVFIREQGTGLHDIHLLSGEQGVAVGKSGTILTTTDGFRSWQRKETKTHKDLYCLDFFDSLNGVAAGADGMMMGTIDGGNSWTSLMSSTKDTLYRISIISSGTAIAVGANGVILKTTDKGKSWSKLQSNTSASLRNIAFRGTIGIAVGTEGALLRSEDLGETWIALNSGTIKDLYTVGWANNTTVLVGGDSTLIFRSNDAGKTWNFDQRIYPVRDKWSANEILDIQFVNDSIGYMCGNFDEVPIVGSFSSAPYHRIFYTKDIGKTWVRLLGTDPNNTSNNPDRDRIYDREYNVAGGGRWSRMAIINMDSILVVGLDPVNVSSKIIAGGPNRPMFEIRLNVETSALLGYANAHSKNIVQMSGISQFEWKFMTLYGELLSTKDAGKTWISSIVGRGGYCFDMQFKDEFGLVTADSGRIYSTHDGGLTWILTYFDEDNKYGLRAPQISDVTILNSNTAFCLEHYGYVDRLISTDDGGKTWKKLELPLDTMSWVSIPYFTDDKKGWLLEQPFTSDSLERQVFLKQGRIHYTDDGGKTWTDRTPYSIMSSKDKFWGQHIDFIDPLHGWITAFEQDSTKSAKGRIPVLFKTNDGGETWTRNVIDMQQFLGSKIDIYSLEFMDVAGIDSMNYILYVSFEFNNKVIRTSDGGKTWKEMSYDNGGLSSNPYRSFYRADSTTLFMFGENSMLCRWKFTKEVTGVDEIIDAPRDGIAISPNPTSTNFTLRGIDNISSMKILNSIGMEVSRMSFNESSKQEVDVSNLPSGVYFVQIRTSTGMISKPIVISR